MSDLYLPKISRRTTLQWIAAAIAGTAIPRSARAERLAIFKPTPKGYGPDPNLNHPVIPWERIMTQRELQLTAVLADMILPATATAPAPSTLGVPDFVNEWISAPYPDQMRDTPIIRNGLASLDTRANHLWGKGFLEINESEKQSLFHQLIEQWQSADPKSAGNTFFYRFRALVLGAYYTTPEGYKDIGYLGNVPLESYPAATEQENAILEREWKKLGL